MPHFVIECSENVTNSVTAAEIMQSVYEAAESTGLFAENDIKVRIRSYQHYKLGEGKNGFIHVFADIMEGRTTEQKANLSKRVIERLNEMFPGISFISMNVREFEWATYSNKSLINPLNTAGDRYF